MHLLKSTIHRKYHPILVLTTKVNKTNKQKVSKNQKKMVKTWTAENDRRLLLAFIASQPSIKFDYNAIALHCGEGVTKDSADHRFRILKKEVKQLQDNVSSGIATIAPATPRKRASPSSSSPGHKANKIQKRNGDGKGGKSGKGGKNEKRSDGGRKFKKEDSVEEEEEEEGIMISEVEGDELPELPDLGSDLEEDADGEEVIEPETPTKIMPSRGAKSKMIGKLKIEESLSEVSDEEGLYD